MSDYTCQEVVEDDECIYTDRCCDPDLTCCEVADKGCIIGDTWFIWVLWFLITISITRKLEQFTMSYVVHKYGPLDNANQALYDCRCHKPIEDEKLRKRTLYKSIITLFSLFVIETIEEIVFGQGSIILICVLKVFPFFMFFGCVRCLRSVWYLFLIAIIASVYGVISKSQTFSGLLFCGFQWHVTFSCISWIIYTINDLEELIFYLGTKCCNMNGSKNLDSKTALEMM